MVKLDHSPNTPEPDSYGPRYTRGQRFRARAEARQRWYRAERLGVGWKTHGHWLDDAAIAAGANFVVPEAFIAAKERDKAGKGVGERTFQNMLSSQAMAFNIFAPLAEDLDFAAEVLSPFIPRLRAVSSIVLEYTPPRALFRDQSGRGGVDCDVMIEATLVNNARAIVIVETKFVEPELSCCSFRESGRDYVCPDDVNVASSRQACAYSSRKNYGYWEQSDALSTLKPLPASGCPFSGPLWQLWVNHTLAHAEAAQRGASSALLLLCAPGGNDALLRKGDVFDSFTRQLANPESARMMELDALLDSIALVAPATRQGWVDSLRARYGRI